MPASQTAPFRYHVITLGCQMNKNDSDRLAAVLTNMGFASTDSPETADVIMLNSCSVRASAEHRIFGLTQNFAKLKEQNPELLIGVTGCMPGRDRDGKMRKQLPHVDFFFPTRDMIHLPKWLSEMNSKFRPVEDMEKDYLALTPQLDTTFQAFVTLQTGCNHFCTYCVVPFARGLEVNRPLKQILEEVHALAARGCVEVTLLGQIVNHYVAPDPEYFSTANPYKNNDFAKLLWEINRIQGIARIHYTAPHPIYMDDEAIDALTLPNQVNFLHLPVQSGSDVMLKKMNRRHTRDFYLDLVKKIRKRVPTIALGTDIIVGFCDETEEDFAQTVDLYKQADFDISYTAQYSERTHTVAAKAFTDSVPKQEKKRRWMELQALMEQTVLRKNQRYVDTTVSVLVDKCEAGFCMGNSREMKRIRFKGTAQQIGTTCSVSIYKAQEWLLTGTQV